MVLYHDSSLHLRLAHWRFQIHIRCIAIKFRHFFEKYLRLGFILIWFSATQDMPVYKEAILIPLFKKCDDKL